MLLWIILLLGGVGVDQTFKYLVINNIEPEMQLKVFPSLLNITYVKNRGAAFGILQNCQHFFVIALVVVVALFFYFIIINKTRNVVLIVASALILGGGISNFIDRITYGYVIDYIQVSFFPPVCNFADYCVTVGAVLLFIYFLFIQNNNEKKTKK